MRHIIFASYGNDSVALVQWCFERGVGDATVVYSDTGWASDDWDQRVRKMEGWVKGLGFDYDRTSSIGLEQLVKNKKGWPRQGMQFCTIELKIKPALAWLDKNDPEKKAVCLVGVRREESLSRRAFPEKLDVSPNHGGRALWAPLVDMTNNERNALLSRAGVEPLPHRSMECFPCVNSNRADLRQLSLDSSRVAEIERIETELGFTSNGKARTMFRPASKMGATGIREVIRWAESDHGKYKSEDEINECESGYCSI